MSWGVTLHRKAQKGRRKLPQKEEVKLALLLKELAVSGPLRANWANYSPLGNNKYHCHLSYSWVACWEETTKGISLEVYYVGSREDAPY